MSFDPEKFIKNIVAKYENDMSSNDIENLLDDIKDYDKDSPVSTGKTLFISRLKFTGQKNGHEINFDKTFPEGIFVLIADNLKGKSSIFKIIKYALTGRDSIKPDIGKCILQISLEFKIGDKNYTAFLDKSSKLKASLYYGKMDSINNDATPIIETDSKEAYKTAIQKFFFRQFDFYSLKWTQKASQKNSTDLNEAKASWNTYFSSIYLESKDSDKLMYGAQGIYIFEMLLGFQLTYAINQLKIKKDKLEHNIALTNSISSDKASSECEIEVITGRLGHISEELKKHNNICDKTSNYSKLYENHDRSLNEARKLKELFSFIEQCEDELKIIDEKIRKNTKDKLDINEYIDAEIFFSNLDITLCPNCNHSVSMNHNHKTQCSLCHQEASIDDKNINIEVFKDKIHNLELTIEELQKEYSNIKESIKDNKEKFYFECPDAKIFPDLKAYQAIISKKLKDIDNQVNKDKQEMSSLISGNLSSLIKEKAVLEYQLEQLNPENETCTDEAQLHVDILADAIDSLKEIRWKENQHIISLLQNLILEEIHDMGLISIDEVRITEKFTIQYLQGGDWVNFDNIAEGEQLRVKLALYLSLIQLDIKENFGRHPRFLIIDSPGKEEGDKKYLEGFSKIIRDVNTKYQKNIQIMIGTAERDLSNCVSEEQEMNIPENEYVF